MLHKGFCSTFQYPCSFIFFILYRFIFTPFLLIRNPPLQLTNSTKWIFSKASPVPKPSTHQSSPGWGDPAVLLCGKPLFKSFSGFINTQIVQHFSSHSQGSTNTKFQHFSNLPLDSSQNFNHFSNLSQGSSQIFYTSLNTNFNTFHQELSTLQRSSPSASALVGVALGISQPRGWAGDLLTFNECADKNEQIAYCLYAIYCHLPTTFNLWFF